MTTNAIDLGKLVLASDSRWSIANGDHFFWVDDTGFDKIADRNRGALICAGDGVLIEQWRNWFLAPLIDDTNLPPTERIVDGQLSTIAASIIEKPSGAVLLSKGIYWNFRDTAWFTGSGAEYAIDCFAKNGCGKLAVQSAAALDYATGGETKFVEIATSANNLGLASVTLQEAYGQLLTRGSAMNTKTRIIQSVPEFLGSANGKPAGTMPVGMSLSAPTGQPPAAWSDEEKRELRAAAKRLADLEKPAND